MSQSRGLNEFAHCLVLWRVDPGKEKFPTDNFSRSISFHWSLQLGAAMKFYVFSPTIKCTYVSALPLFVHVVHQVPS